MNSELVATTNIFEALSVERMGLCVLIKSSPHTLRSLGTAEHTATQRLHCCVWSHRARQALRWEMWADDGASKPRPSPTHMSMDSHKPHWCQQDGRRLTIPTQLSCAPGKPTGLGTMTYETPPKRGTHKTWKTVGVERDSIVNKISEGSGMCFSPELRRAVLWSLQSNLKPKLGWMGGEFLKINWLQSCQPGCGLQLF